jgi:hypothetical protein
MDAPRPHADHAPAEPALSSAVIFAVLAASAAVAGFAVSGQSFWIDEARSLVVAMASSPAEAWKYAQAVGGSTLQMPLYHVGLYAWHKFFGGGEWIMRASNIPWFLLGQLAFLVLLRDRPRLALTACLLAAVSPVLWIYLDETRPYVMQYAAACWLTAALLRLSAPGARHAASDPGLLAAAPAALVLFGSSLLGALWACSFVAALVWLLASAPRSAAAHPPSRPTPPVVPILLLVGIGAAALVLLVYFVWTWPAAAGGYPRSSRAWLGLPFVAYELLGFTGFGPGKLEIRASPARSLLASLPALAPLGLGLLLLGLFGVRQWRGQKPGRRQLIAGLLAFGPPTVAICGALLVFDHRMLPRHFMPVLPALLLWLAALIVAAFARKAVLWRAVAVLLPLLWLASSLNYRWRPAHAKDNYRTAAALAAAALADNKEVWWAADPAAAYIYLTPVAFEDVPGRAWAMQAPSWDEIRFKFPPRVIVISKPDIFDAQGSIRRYAAENQFAPARELQAFTILTRKGEALPATAP